MGGSNFTSIKNSFLHKIWSDRARPGGLTHGISGRSPQVECLEPSMLLSLSSSSFDSPRESTLASDGFAAGGLAFDGTSDYITVGQVPTLRLTSQITIAAWVRPESFPNWGGLPACEYCSGTFCWCANIAASLPFRTNYS